MRPTRPPSRWRCPRCSARGLYRPRRRGLAWLLSLTRPYRCDTCEGDFWRPGLPDWHEPPRPLA
jgi:DNA-directed RNA polymerase subunit RPC12/RpoP